MKSDVIRKLKAQQSASLQELLQAVRSARERVAGRITAAATKQNIATSFKSREALFRQVGGYYGKLGADIDAWAQGMTRKVALSWHGQANTDIQAGTDAGAVIKFDPERIKTYWQMIHPDNSQYLAATFTQQMTKEDIASLRQSFVETFRKSSIEGLTHQEINKALQSKWNEVAGSIASDRFTDRAGRTWDNARYMQMLVRTTTTRIARESYIDTLVAHGDDLMRIVNVMESCELCEAWDGVIISVSGANSDYPSYQDALDAGWAHPQCDCQLERVDETLDKEDIARQADTENPKDWADVDQVAEYKLRFAA